MGSSFVKSREEPLPMNTTGTKARSAHVVAVLLLALQAGVLLHAAAREGLTYDEPMYLLAGRAYWDDFDFSFNREHPPLTKLLIGLPLKADGMAVTPSYQVEPGSALRFLHELNDRPLRAAFLGRLGPILLGLLLALYVYLMGTLWAGPKAGLGALATLIAMPVVTGNAPLAALDVGVATFLIMATYHFARLRLLPTPGRTLAAGVTVGLALLTKFSALILLPVFGLLTIVDAVRSRSARPLVRLTVMGFVALTTMYIGYGGEMRTVESVREHPRFARPGEEKLFIDPLISGVVDLFGERPIPILSYLKGLDHLKSGTAASMYPNYLMGELRRGEGWWWFYLVGFAVKTPVGILLLLAMALMLAPWLAARGKVMDALWIVALLTLLTFSLASKQVGMRYVLPVIPIAALLVGRLFTFDPASRPRATAAAAIAGLVVLPMTLFFAFGGFAPTSPLRLAALLLPIGAGLFLARSVLTAAADLSRRHLRVITAALLALGAVEAAARHPEHLMFYNAYAGGPDHGWKISSVGDDWGQGTAALARLQKEKGWGTIRYAYYGTSRPDAYDLDYLHWGGRPVQGLVAIHAVLLTREHATYSYLDGLEPIARADSVLIFDVPEDVLAAAIAAAEATSEHAGERAATDDDSAEGGEDGGDGGE